MPGQQTLFPSPPAIHMVGIYCLTSVESGKVLLLLLTINIYEPVNGPRGQFIIMMCRPLYGCIVIQKLVAPSGILNLEISTPAIGEFHS